MNDMLFDFVEGDLIELDVDVIVNLVNEGFKLGFGVVGVILEKGGKFIQDECNCIGSIFVGMVVMIGVGIFEVKQVIYVVGFKMGEGDEDCKLVLVVCLVLVFVDCNGFKFIGILVILMGSYGFFVDWCV